MGETEGSLFSSRTVASIRADSEWMASECPANMRLPFRAACLAERTWLGLSHAQAQRLTRVLYCFPGTERKRSRGRSDHTVERDWFTLERCGHHRSLDIFCPGMTAADIVATGKGITLSCVVLFLGMPLPLRVSTQPFASFSGYVNDCGVCSVDMTTNADSRDDECRSMIEPSRDSLDPVPRKLWLPSSLAVSPPRPDYYIR